MVVLAVADGAAIVVVGMDPPPGNEREADRGTLSFPAEVASCIGDAIAAGVTFDVLKEASVALVRRGWTKRVLTVTAESITQTVLDYLRSCGYVNVVLSEVKRVGGEGWTLKGSVDGARFSVMADEGGHVVHVRVR